MLYKLCNTSSFGFFCSVYSIILFIPGVMILNSLWQLNGVIAAQPVVETVLAIICIAMYTKDSRITAMGRSQKQQINQNVEVMSEWQK